MGRISVFCFVVLGTISAYSQTALPEGNACFEKGDYDCAITKYREALKSALGSQREIISINLANAEECVNHINIANREFISKSYAQAKGSYQKALDLNPKDIYVKTQIAECDRFLAPSTTLTISKKSLSFSFSGGTEHINVSTNADSYEISRLPSWSSVHKNEGGFTIECIANSSSSARADYFTVTAGDKTVRVDISQSGRTSSLATTLSTSTQNVSFDSSGGSATVEVKTTESDYQITYLPTWCKVGAKYPGGFSLVCDVHHSSQLRSDWFKVAAGGKEVTINISQAGASLGAHLTVSKENLHFPVSGGLSTQIKVFSITGTYSISLVPYWCSVKKYDDFFVVSCQPNNEGVERSSWFRISAGSNDLKVYVKQDKGNISSGQKKSADQKDRNKPGSGTRHFAIGLESGLIAPYGLRLEYTGRKGFGVFANVRSSLLKKEDILSEKKLENKNEAIGGLIIKLAHPLYLNLGGGIGYIDLLQRNDYAGSSSVSQKKYLAGYCGITLRINKAVAISGGASFMNDGNGFYMPEYTLGLTFRVAGK